MTDAAHPYGNDLAFGPTGDIATVTGTAAGQQRVLRRLLTNPGAYIWNLSYGAGLGAFVGQVNAGTRLRSVARRQMLLEAAVAASPPPGADVTATNDGRVNLTISYVDAPTGASVTETIPVS